MMRHIRQQVFAAAVVAGVMLGFGSSAGAAIVTFDPSATNTGNGSTANGSPTSGTGNNGNFALDSAQGAFSATGGNGQAFTNMFIASGTGASGVAFNGDMVVNIANFSGLTHSLCASGASSSCSGWQLFALITVTGTGGWSGSTFTAASATEQFQLYGVNNSGDAKKATISQTSGLNGGGNTHSPFNFERPHDNNTTPANNTLVPGQSVTFDDLTGHNPVTSFTYPHFNVNGAGGNNSTSDINPGNTAASTTEAACWDGGASSNPPTNTNCILLADGTVTADTYSVNKTSLMQSFSLSALLDPEGYAAGTDGFFDSDPANMLLSIYSGDVDGVANLVTVCDPGGCNPLDLKEIDSGAGTTSTANDDVKWDIAGIPEPGSLALFGSGLLALGFVARRKRKQS
jgi:hypothetical protein